MSFGEMVNIEEGGMDANVAVQKITTNIQQLNQCVQQLNQSVEKIGGMGDNERTRNSISELIHKSNELSHETNKMLKELITLGNNDRQLRVQGERLMNDFMSVLSRMQAAKRKAATREKTQIKSVTVEDQQLDASRTGMDDPIQMQHLQQQHRMNLDEIRGRQQALSELEQDIGDINQIFKDLAHMVHDQGDMVDSIEANIEQASISVQQGRTQVDQALQYQTKARRKKLFLSLFCIAVLFILILVLYLWARK